MRNCCQPGRARTSPCGSTDALRRCGRKKHE
jgi:hypothetical protein